MQAKHRIWKVRKALNGNKQVSDEPKALIITPSLIPNP
jgi:hypothetical protein